MPSKKKTAAAKPAVKPVYKDKPKPAPAKPELQEQKDRIIARLMADHGLSLAGATAMVENSKPAKKLKPEITAEDNHVRTVTVDFVPRAGVTSYTVEMHERLKDLEDERNRVFYVLPVRLPKKLYSFLLQDALSEAEDSGYTEEMHIHAILTEKMALSTLTSPKASE